jgi:hypothetical protein
MKTKVKFNPIPTDIGDSIGYSEGSSTGLINKVYRSSNATKGQEAGGVNDREYFVLWFRGKSYKNHRVIYFLKTGIDPEEKEVDHKDTNSSNNKFSNLRLATHAQNQHNKSRQGNNTSGVIGVYWDEKRKRWRCQIKYKSKNIDLGSFINFDEAVAVRIAAEYRLHGEYRRGYNDHYKLTPEMLEWGKKNLEDRIERLNWDI